MNKTSQINALIDNIAMYLGLDIPQNYVENVKKHYLNDNRSFEEISNEINNYVQKIRWAQSVINKEIDIDVLENSILLIGPMGTGKTMLSDELQNKTNMPKISLDDRKISYYRDFEKFKSSKEFEFYLTSSVLTNLKEPSIIDFGAGHSIYENPIMFLMIKQLISQFKNIFLILPSENIEESLLILNERLKIREGENAIKDMETNRHFLSISCNYELATNVIYTNNLSLKEISEEILRQIGIKKIK